MSQPPQTKSAAETIRLLARAVNEHLPVNLLHTLHIKTPVEEEIVFNAQKERVVIVTGSPGDGKTHLIRRAQVDFPKNTTLITDGNQLEPEDVVKTIHKAVSDRTPLVMAINEGILLHACHPVESRHTWARDVVNSVLHPYFYERSVGDGEESKKASLIVFDLTHRNNLANDVVQAVLDRVTSLVLHSETSMSENARRLQNATVQERLYRLLDAIARTGFHATMRDLLGFLAHLLCGGEDELDRVPPRPYYVNAFEEGEGPLFTAVRKLDPVRVPSPFLDDRLFEDDDSAEEWLIDAPEESNCGRDLNNFSRRKRRAFFEHTEGSTLLRNGHNDVQGKLQQLREPGQSPERVAIALLNRFFDSSAISSDALTLWAAHRYHARPVRYLASSGEISANEFQVRGPRLPSYLEKAFPQHYGDHVVLAHQNMETKDGLVMDERLIGQLLDGDRVAGLGVRDPEAYAKVSSFYDRLSRGVRPGISSVVRILRSDTMQQVRVGVNIEKKAYFIPGDLT